MGIGNFLQKASASDLVHQLNLVVISKKNASELGVNRNLYTQVPLQMQSGMGYDEM